MSALSGLSFLPVAPWPVLALFAVVALALVWWPAGPRERAESKVARGRRTALVVLLLVAALRPAVPGNDVRVDASAVDVYFVVDTTSSVMARDYGDRAAALIKVAIASSGDDPNALNNIAWIRATHADASHRDGTQALRLAEQARDAASEPNHVLFSTLAAAFAENGRFAEAVGSAQRAIELAQGVSDEEAVRRYEAQLAGYRRNQPFHQ